MTNKKWNYKFWIDDSYETVVPDGSGKEFVIWWEDMRPKEVLELIKEAYISGYERGLEENSEDNEVSVEDSGYVNLSETYHKDLKGLTNYDLSIVSEPKNSSSSPSNFGDPVSPHDAGYRYKRIIND